MAQKNRRRNRREPPRRWPYLLLSALINLALFALARYVLMPLIDEARRPAEPTEELVWMELAPKGVEPQLAERHEAPDPRRQQLLKDAPANERVPEQAKYWGEKDAAYEKQTRGKHGALPEGEELKRPGASPEDQGETPARQTEGQQTAKTDGKDVSPPAEEPRRRDTESLFPSREQIAKLLEQQRRRNASGDQSGEGGGSRNPSDLNPERGHGIDALDPAIQEGPFTLLNQKSFKHAGFLKRVLERVWDYYGKQVQDAVRLGLIREGDESTVVVHSVMSTGGNHLRTEIQELYGSPALAEAARSAMERNIWDNNPPAAAAAEDGNIHFKMIAKLRYVGRSRYEYSVRFGIL